MFLRKAFYLRKDRWGEKGVGVTLGHDLAHPGILIMRLKFVQSVVKL
jgi:hypothetical protein